MNPVTEYMRISKSQQKNNLLNRRFASELAKKSDGKNNYRAE
jgi:hypothetical protein